MKNWKIKTGLLALSIIVLASCNSDKYTISYNLVKGETYPQNILLYMDMSVKANEMPVDMNFTVDMKTQSKVIDIENDSFILDIYIDDIKLTAKAMNKQILLNSNTEDSLATFDHLDPILKAVTKNPFRMVVDKQGKVESLTGFNTLANNILNVLHPEMADPAIMQQVNVGLKQSLNDNNIGMIFKNLPGMFPAKPVAIGKSWSINYPKEEGVESKYKIKLESVENNIAAITSTSTYTLKNNADLKDVTFNGSENGTYTIDLNTGWTISATDNYEIAGEVLNNGTKTPFTLKITLTVAE